MRSGHAAVTAGLVLSVVVGAAGLPAYACADEAPALTTETDGALPEPGDYDRALDYEADPAADGDISLLAAGTERLVPQTLSNEMKYFADNESGSNYDQGFSYGDGYNAMGFYQFDRRFSLLDFLKGCYSYDSVKYAMFAPVIERGSELQNSPIYDKETKQLTEIGQLAEDAWHAAYRTDPAEFSALQDAFAYQEYYLPVERILRNNFGVDISGRADCVKGLAWGLCNLFGSGGCQKFFRIANLSDAMSDRQFVNALCDAVVNNVDNYAYGASYKARYERERATCLSYISVDEGLPSNGLPFVDVGNEWYYGAVSYVYANGYMNGIPGTPRRFLPDTVISRQDMACVLYNIFGKGAQAPACRFADVDQGEYYANAVNWAVEKGYMNGIKDENGVYTRFGVGEQMTREQLVTVVANIARTAGDSMSTDKYHSMLDWNETSPWAVDNVIWALNKGVLEGADTGNGRLVDGRRSTTRAEIATVVMRCVQKGIFNPA